MGRFQRMGAMLARLGEVDLIPLGSSLKFLRVADGSADLLQAGLRVRLQLGENFSIKLVHVVHYSPDEHRTENFSLNATWLRKFSKFIQPLARILSSSRRSYRGAQH